MVLLETVPYQHVRNSDRYTNQENICHVNTLPYRDLPSGQHCAINWSRQKVFILVHCPPCIVPTPTSPTPTPTPRSRRHWLICPGRSHALYLMRDLVLLWYITHGVTSCSHNVWLTCCTSAEPVARRLLIMSIPSGYYVKIGTRWLGQLLKRPIFIEMIHIINWSRKVYLATEVCPINQAKNPSSVLQTPWQNWVSNISSNILLMTAFLWDYCSLGGIFSYPTRCNKSCSSACMTARQCSVLHLGCSGGVTYLHSYPWSAGLPQSGEEKATLEKQNR